jgi:hypothetical protein
MLRHTKEGYVVSPRTERLIQGIFVCCSALAGIAGVAVSAFSPDRPLFDRILLGTLGAICLFTAIHAATRKRTNG